ncbi:unnamed protein product [Chrysoparadoxa australica]
MGSTSDEPCAYAKLWGKRQDEDFVAYIKELPVKLGRSRMGTTSEEGIDLGPCKALSRHHATIDWDANQKAFKITAFGKNEILVGREWLPKGSECLLPSKVNIKMGTCRLYFLAALGEGDAGAEAREAEPADPVAPTSDAVSPTRPLENGNGHHSREECGVKRLKVTHESTSNAAVTSEAAAAVLVPPSK